MNDCPLRRAWATQRWRVVLGAGLVVVLIGAIAAGAFWLGRHSPGVSRMSTGATADEAASSAEAESAPKGSAVAAATLVFPEPPKLAPDEKPPGLRATRAGAGFAQVGQPAPDFWLFRSGGGWLRLSQLRGSVVVVNFWASWCPPCQMEMPWFRTVLEQKKLPAGAVLVGVDIQEDAQTVGRFLQQGGYNWPVALDTSGEVAMAYRVSAIPTTYLISAQGTVLKMHRGIMTEEMLIAAVQEAVAASQKEAQTAAGKAGAPADAGGQKKTA